MTLHKNLHWFIYVLFLLSCARQSSPTGGPKDTIPPTLVRSIPPNEAINFKGSKIELEFSEDVVLITPKEQLIVTPTIGKDYKITYRKNFVTIEFEDPLQDSTTYTFSFREAVGDITEKNPVRNLHLAYSTGTYIDSLSIDGRVYDLLKGKELEDVTVALHPENDTINILEHPAVYFTKSDKQGRFKISHLKPGNYFVYAFQDKNRNLVVNSRSESYGFLAEEQYLIDNISDLSIGLIRLDAGPLRMTSARPYNTYFNIRTSKNLRTFTLAATDSSELSYTFGEDAANIRIYPTTASKDSIQVHLLALDSLNNAIDTTLYAKYNTREVTPEKFDMTISSTSLLAHTGEMVAVIQFTKPIKEVNFDSLFFQVDSLTRVNFLPENLTWEPLHRRMTIRQKLDPKLFPSEESNRNVRRGGRPQPQPDTAQSAAAKRVLLNEFTTGKGAFISIEGDSSRKITQNLKPLTQPELAVINIEIRTKEPQFIVQLLDNSGKVLREVSNLHKVRFQDVIPGDYQARLIIDRNANGRWDPGNYFTATEPEPVIYYRAPDKTTAIKGVKANWEIGTDGEMFITY